MGKKQLAQLQPSELVTTILISNIATLSLEDLSVPMIYGVIPILMVVSMDVIMSHVMLKSTNIRRMVTGTPQIIISDGKIDQQVMKRLRYTIDELMEAMRECMIFDLSEVQYAIVETTGKINFFQKSCYRNVEKGDLDIKQINCNPPSLLIKDGEINVPALARFEGGELRIKKLLSEKKLSMKNVFIMTYSDDKGVNIILKDKKK
ncbi:MAG: DUF421 domain-containing protein [Ruminiclostridium sp.]|nr:DUF421 domain-containing protein [Ruminiclostridium sp.]